MKRLLYIVAIAILATSCSVPLSKVNYMNKFDSFVTEVSENHKRYSDKDWEKKTKKYKKFSGKWYNKFKPDFTLKDEIAIKAYQVKFNYCRTLSQTASIIDILLKTVNIKKMKKQAQYYLDNDMKSDLLKLYEESKKAGKKAEAAVIQIFKELNIKLEDLK